MSFIDVPPAESGETYEAPWLRFREKECCSPCESFSLLKPIRMAGIVTEA
jgi:hypothetical protein